MAKSRTKKQDEVAAIVSDLGRARGVVFANFAGLDVKATQELRRQCRTSGVSYTVAKKTLLKIAFDQAFIAGVNARELQGNVAVMVGFEDEISAAKVVREFSKKNPALTFVGGLLPQGESWTYLDASAVTDLSKLPSKEELLGQLVGTLVAPIRDFVSVLSGPQRSFVQVLSAIKDSRA